MFDSSRFWIFETGDMHKKIFCLLFKFQQIFPWSISETQERFGHTYRVPPVRPFKFVQYSKYELRQREKNIQSKGRPNRRQRYMMFLFCRKFLFCTLINVKNFRSTIFHNWVPWGNTLTLWRKTLTFKPSKNKKANLSYQILSAIHNVFKKGVDF